LTDTDAGLEVERTPSAMANAVQIAINSINIAKLELRFISNSSGFSPSASCHISYVWSYYVWSYYVWSYYVWSPVLVMYWRVYSYFMYLR